MLFRSNKLMSSENLKRAQPLLQCLENLSEKYKTSIGNVALNWLISQDCTFAIVGARNEQQVLENAKACDFVLQEDELKLIDSLSQKITSQMEQSGMMWDWG